jgi:hypothetical protein
MTGPLIGALNVRAIHAYEVEDVSALPGLRRLGAVMALHGIAVNGGLVGGGVETSSSTIGCTRSTTRSRASSGSG